MSCIQIVRKILIHVYKVVGSRYGEAVESVNKTMTMVEEDK